MKKLYTFIGILIAVAIISISIFLLYSDNRFVVPIDNNNPITNYDYAEGVSVAPGDYLEPVFNDLTGDFRPIYKDMKDEQYAYFFDELPEFKQDFFTIAQLVFDGKITDYARLSENYWKQPEFYPGWFSSVEDAYIYNDPYMWTPEGYGCYPAIKEISANKGSSITVNTYLRTGYATEAYQGLVIKPLLPDTAISLRGNTIFEQPQDVDKYLSVSIGNADNAMYDSFKDTLFYNNVGEADWMIILKPTYQLLLDKYGEFISEQGFPTDWVRIIEYNIDIASDIPSGDYVCSIDIVPPSFGINQEFYFSDEHEYYGALYHPSGGFHRTSMPHFQIILHID